MQNLMTEAHDLLSLASAQDVDHMHRAEALA